MESSFTVPRLFLLIACLPTKAGSFKLLLTIIRLLKTSSLAIGEYLAGLILCITDGPLHSHSRNQCPGTHQRFSTGGKLDDWAN
ncbi:hypothetical protein MJO28_005994 [Puccinia striiformis f. sp. tritici]|uniref:Uncharacterized protein n=1 Tax=Puccinia striiformis f. sp. tritici TaxID=168172 RepID=A0ACC0EFQ3_9BASI|nr:hypothetical protein MJO28_005994 [Puccinia striiformis f. sp. tritici]